MKKKIKFLLGSFILVLCLSACSKQGDVSTENPSTEQEVSQTETVQTEGFDIEVARKNIIKGQPFEIPVALGDLKDGWTWEENEDSLRVSGGGLADIYLNGEQWYTVGLDNFYEGAEDQGIIYNLTIKTDDCSIDGIVPYQTTKQEVLDEYGDSDDINQEYNIYYYGTTNNISYWPYKEQRITFQFNEKDIVILVSITYADLTE